MHVMYTHIYIYIPSYPAVCFVYWPRPKMSLESLLSYRAKVDDWLYTAQAKLHSGEA